jgi:hypothetical protein
LQDLPSQAHSPPNPHHATHTKELQGKPQKVGTGCKKIKAPKK